MCESSSATSKIINLPVLSKIHFSTLESGFGFMRIISPWLFVVPWLKKTLPPHSADHASALSFELWVSWRNVKCTFWLWIYLKTDQRFIDLLRPLVLTERHLMSRFSIGFVLKGVKHLEMRNGKLDPRSDFDSFVLSSGIEAICIFWSWDTFLRNENVRNKR